MHHSQPCQNWEQTVPTIWIGLSELNFAELSDLKKPKQETSFPPLTPGSLQCWDRCCSNDGEETCGNAVREIKLQKSRNQRNQADVLAVTCLQGRLGGAPSSVKQPILPLLEAKVLLWEASDMQCASMSYQSILLHHGLSQRSHPSNEKVHRKKTYTAFLNSCH